MENLHYLLMKANALFLKRILAEAGQMGLTPGQPKVLDFLLQYEEADQKTIAAYCEIEPATVGSILLRMENAGLIRRRQKEGNRRSLYVSLTDSGREKAERLMEVFRSVEAQGSAGFSQEEMQTLKEQLTRVCRNIQPASGQKKGQQ